MNERQRARLTSIQEEGAAAQWQSFVAASGLPLFRLAAAIGHLEEPFGHLREQRGGFYSSVRYVLERSLEGDPEAKAVLRDWLLSEEWRLARTAFQGGGLFRSYCIENAREIDAFKREHYPWEVLRPKDVIPFSDLLDSLLLPVLVREGFQATKRRVTPRTWRCSVPLRGETLEVLCEVTQRSSDLGMYLLVKGFQFRQCLAYPFALSGCAFTAVDRTLLAKGLESFTVAFSAIAPAVVRACDEGVRAGLEVLDVE